MGTSQTQNVQRGIIMLFFFQFLLLTIVVIMRFCKNKIDKEEDNQPSASKKYEEGDKPNKSQNHKESQDSIGADFDKTVVKREELKQDATCAQRFMHGAQQFVYYYCPYFILLPLNILTGTSKAFTLTLFFIITVCITLFNVAKIHRKLGDSKCLNVVFENLWLFLSFFYFVNQWGATPVAMPYILK